MINRFLIFLLLLVSLKIYSGDGVGNGGGIAENNIVFAYNTLGEYIDFSLSQSIEIYSLEEVEILGEIKNSLIKEYQNKKQLIFLSGKKYPDIFIIPFGEVRIAVTGSSIGSPIYFNTDLLYTEDFGVIGYLAISQAISILIHEFGHHHGINDELFLNTLGSKVAKSVYKKFEKRELRNFENIFLEYINLGNLQTPQLHIADSIDSFDLTDDLKEKVECPNKGSLRGIKIWQSSWSKYRSPHWFVKNELVIFCKNGEIIEKYGDFEYLISPTFIKRNNEIRIKEIKTNISRCNPRVSIVWPNKRKQLIL